MATHEFIVSVDVDDWPAGQVAASDWPERTEEEYAGSALYASSLRDARSLDGYADLDFGSATITSVSKA